MDRYQKTISYGIVGNGFLATHLTYYFDLEGIKYTRWIRSIDQIDPVEKFLNCDTVLLPISDDQIENFIKLHAQLKSKRIIHFSGALTINGSIALHPLMTFSNNLYTLEQYRNIPFIGESGDDNFNNCFPILKNPYYQIKTDQKPLYHALCVLGGNFTTILWQKVIDEFEIKLNLPKEVLFNYFDQVCSNIKLDHKNALTGPVKRQDKKTIIKNIKALNGDLWKKLYRLFNKIYKSGIKKRINYEYK